MRIAFDVDGVLADMHTPFSDVARRIHPNLDPAALDDPGMSRRQLDAVWEAIGSTDNFWETLGEIEDGAVARLATLADERGWEVIFVTSRPASAGRTVQRQTQRWLAAKGFPLPSVYVVNGSRGQIASALAIDVVVDDRPDNCLDVVLESKAGALLVWRRAAAIPVSAKRLGIMAVPSVSSLLEALLEVDRATEGEGSLVDRLRRLFGFKPRTPQSMLR